MRATIASQTFDLSGYVELDITQDSDNGDIIRRVSRASTLDGGSSITDRGYSDSDRTINYTWRSVSQAHNESIARLVELYPLLNVSTDEGVFSAAPVRFQPGRDESRLSLYVKEKVS